MPDVDALRDRMSEERIEFVDLKVADLLGRWRHVTVPSARFDASVVERGIAFDASNLGYASVEGSDMRLRPDLGTATVAEEDGDRVLSVICDVYPAASDEPFRDDPRGIARRTERLALRETGADDVRLSPELEFYVFQEARFVSDECSSGYTIDPMSGRSGLSFYHICPPEDRLLALRNGICRELHNRGIAVRYHHHEVGARGQQEIELGFHGVVEAADATLLAKQATRRLAADRGWVATFLPKPLHGQNGSGLHVHQYLGKGGTSLFEGNGGLSELALCYVGGILSHGRSLCALTNASTNSYRRLVPGYEAPVWFAFGEGNRSAAVRIPRYADAKERRIELRTVDATCNPYLAYSAMVLAGLDGIRRGLNAEQLGFGPFAEDLYRLDAERASRLAAAPRSLGEALDSLEQDHDYLVHDGVFSADQVAQWIRAKRREVTAVGHRPHPYEFSLYFDL